MKKKRSIWMYILFLGLYCEPVTIALMVVGLMMAAASAVQQSQAAKRQANQQADLMRSQQAANDEILRQQAEEARRNAQWADYQIQVQKEQTAIKKAKNAEEAAIAIGKIRNKGVRSGSGTLLARTDEALENWNYEDLLLQWEGDLKVWEIEELKSGFVLEAGKIDWKAASERKIGSQAATNIVKTGRRAAAGSLLVGGSNVALSAANASNKGMFSGGGGKPNPNIQANRVVME